MTTKPVRCQTVDDRLALIEDLLIKISMRLDRVEQDLSVIQAYLPQSRRIAAGDCR
jgi:hypothetical protein